VVHPTSALLDEHSVVVPVAFMGAPTISLEKPGQGNELISGLNGLQASLSSRICGVVSEEIGGQNGLAVRWSAEQLFLKLSGDFVLRNLMRLLCSRCLMCLLCVWCVFDDYVCLICVCGV